jgi:hypothetical protein
MDSNATSRELSELQLRGAHYGTLPPFEIPFHPAYRFFDRDYRVFGCGGMALSEANLKSFASVPAA